MGKGKIDFELYLITDRKLITRHLSSCTGRCRASLVTIVKQALRGGVSAVQLREKDLGTRDMLKLAYKMRELTAGYGARLFINDRLDIALAVGADGIHLTRESMPAATVRKVVRNSFLVGVSTHSIEEAREAQEAGADFITFGPVYRTPAKLKYGKPAGIDRLKKVCAEMSIPVFALGGIKALKIDEVMKAGAYGVSMISEILCAKNKRKKAEELINIIESG